MGVPQNHLVQLGHGIPASLATGIPHAPGGLAGRATVETCFLAQITAPCLCEAHGRSGRGPLPLSSFSPESLPLVSAKPAGCQLLSEEPHPRCPCLCPVSLLRQLAICLEAHSSRRPPCRAGMQESGCGRGRASQGCATAPRPTALSDLGGEGLLQERPLRSPLLPGTWGLAWV